MKKKIIIVSSIIILVMLLIYIVNYKSLEEIKVLLSKGTALNNVYAEKYVDLHNFNSMNNVKTYKIDIYWKDNILIYKGLNNIISYYNFNINDFFVLVDNDKHQLDEIDVAKFNQKLYYETNYKYKYLFFTFYEGNICDVIEIATNENKKIYYINQSNGLVMKTIQINQDNSKDIETYNYQFDIITNEQIQKIINF